MKNVKQVWKGGERERKDGGEGEKEKDVEREKMQIKLPPL